MAILAREKLVYLAETQRTAKNGRYRKPGSFLASCLEVELGYTQQQGINAEETRDAGRTRFRTMRTNDPWRSWRLPVPVRQTGLGERTGLGVLSHKKPGFFLLFCLPQEEKVLIHKSRPVLMPPGWLPTPACSPPGQLDRQARPDSE